MDYIAAINSEEYIKARQEYLAQLTREYLVEKTQMMQTLDRLRSELTQTIRALDMELDKRRTEYNRLLVEDYRKWKTQTEND
jgi:hypothetical protein